jgi:hypothetical protein
LLVSEIFELCEQSVEGMLSNFFFIRLRFGRRPNDASPSRRGSVKMPIDDQEYEVFLSVSDLPMTKIVSVLRVPLRS